MDMLHDPFTGQHLQFRRTGKQTAGQLLEVEVLLDPGGQVPRHLHLRQDERVEVLEGTLSIRLGEAQRRLTQGDSIEVPRRTLHRVANAAAGRSRFLLQVRPARRMETAMRILFASLGCWAISAGPLSDLGVAVILSDVVAVMLADRELDRRPANRW